MSAPEEPRGAGGLDAAELDDLLRAVLRRVQGVLDEQDRLRLLLDAVMTMAADLSLDGVLARIVETVSRLAGAQYAALGVLSAGPGRRLRTFVHHGMAPVQVAEIGDLPEGHGLLGQIIDRPEPLRLHDIAAHPQSYGFPPHHPPMQSFLGVPVRIRDQVFGNLYLTEKLGGGDFTQQDEDVVVALAAAAGVAIENARLYEEVERREAWAAATAEVTSLLSGGAGGAGGLQVIADRARITAEADAAWVLCAPESGAVVVEVASGAGSDVSLDADSPVMSAVRAGAAVSRPDGGVGVPGLGAAMVRPVGDQQDFGRALVLAWAVDRAERFHAVDLAQPAGFVEQAALALQLARAREDRQRLAVFEDRDRIGRDLHDLVIQRLFAVGLGLQGAARMAEAPELAARLEQAVDDLDDTIKDIRNTIFSLGSIETSGDVQAEIARIVDRAAATLKFRPRLRFEGPVRTLVRPDLAPDLLAVLGEALSNASRHASASAVDVVVTVGDEMELVVADDGRGLPPDVVESGLHNMRQRAERRGGALEIESSPDGGTRLRWVVPLTSSS